MQLLQQVYLLQHLDNARQTVRARARESVSVTYTDAALGDVTEEAMGSLINQSQEERERVLLQSVCVLPSTILH